MKVGKWVVACASAVGMTLASQSASAFGMMEVGEWKVEFSGNVNAFLHDLDCEAGAGPVAGGLACGSSGINYSANNVRTGLLPSWFGFHAERTEGDTKYGVTIGFQPGVDGANQGGGAPGPGGPIDGALGLNASNFRQVFLEFSNESWGSLKIGRDLGLFGSDAILSDMTLLGVGTVSDLTQAGGNTSLGRIGVGYLYADWKAQLQYASPKFGGLQFNVAIVDPWGLGALGPSSSRASYAQEGSTFGFEAKAVYSFEGDIGGKVWASLIRQAIDSAVFPGEDAQGFDVGAQLKFGDLEAVAYYYTGEAIGTTGFLLDALDVAGNTRDSDGMYAQLTYKIPGPGTKLGVSWGESNLDLSGAEPVSALLQTNESVVFGVYHPITSALNLVFEYTQTEATAHNGNQAEETGIALGAILFF
jgi:predicted porin